MRLRSLLALGAATFFIGQPLAAQDAGQPANGEAQAIANMAEMFAAEPLTEEQETRLPAAELVVLKLMPPGTYMKMMDGTMQPMMEAINSQFSDLPLVDLMRMTGLPEDEIKGLGKGTLREIMAIYDPAFEERQEVIFNTTIKWVTSMMDEMEPSFRAGLARAYAVRFSQSELEELGAFFSTPAGAHYAEESMLIMADPQVMATTGEILPRMFESMPEMMAIVEEETAKLPPPRDVEDLTDEEMARLNELLGLSS